MKAIVGGQSKGMLGEFIYTHEFQRGLGHRVRWDNPPPSGTLMIHGLERVTVDFIRWSGLIVFTRGSDGAQSSAFPWDLHLPN